MTAGPAQASRQDHIPLYHALGRDLFARPALRAAMVDTRRLSVTER